MLTLLGIFIFSFATFAMNGRTTYQAKIVKPDGYPLESASVNFQFTVLDTVGSCVLYTETYTAVDMRSTGGLISFALGNGVRGFPASGTTAVFANVFDNSIVSMPCQSPGIYNPGPSDTRKIVMQFNDGNGWQTLPAMTINSVPYAMYATKSNDSKTLNGKADTAFVENSTLAALNCNPATHAITFNGVSFSCIPVGSGGGGITSVTTSGTVLVTGGTASAPVISIKAVTMSQDGYLTSLDYAEFKAKLAASSTQIVNTLGYAPVSGAAVTTQINNSNLSGDVSGTISSNSVVSVGGKTAAQISTSVNDTLAATSSNTASTIVKRDSSGNFTANDIYANAAKINYVDIYRPSTSFNIRLQAPTSLSTNYVLNLPTTSGTTGQVLSTDGSGNLSWINPSTRSVVSVSATAPLASTGGSNPTISITQANSTTNGYLSSADWNTFNNKQNATSAAIIATLGYTPANATSASPWTTSGSAIFYNTGNVGVGTSNPTSAFHIGGAPVATSNYGLVSIGNGPFDGTSSGFFSGNANGVVHAINTATGFTGDFARYQNGTSDSRFIIKSNGSIVSGRGSANGTLASTFGGLNTANGSHAFVVGHFNNATGSYSFSSGLFNNATGDNSTAMGYYVTANSLGMTALGINNVVPTGTSTNTWVATDPIFVIGNGQGSLPASASTALTVLKNGNAGIGVTAPVTKLEILGGVRISMESATCATSYAGTLRYNSGNVEYCNGTAWQAFGVSGAGITSINGSTSGTQSFANGTASTTPSFATANGVHTLNIPLASVGTTTAGLISNADYTSFANKITSNSASIAQVLGYTPVSATSLSNYLVRANNLSDLTSSATARTNLGVGYIGTLTSVDLGSSDVSGTLAIGRTPAYVGDVTKAAASNTLILSNSGVTAGTYTKVTVDGKGRVTSSSSLASSDVTAALGYTPANATSATQWTTSGTNIFYNTGNVGIGTTNPAASFEISGTIKINGGSPGVGKVLVSDANGLASWQTTTPLGGASYDSGWFNIACDKTYQLNLGFTGFPKQLNAYYKLSNGQIIPWGVNHYGDSFQMNGVVLDYDSTGKIYVRTSTPNGSYICGLFHVGYTRNRLDNGFDDLFNQNTGVQFRVIASDGAGGSQWSTASGSISYSEGNVGIGTTLPTAKLHLSSGTATTAAFKMTSGSLLTTPSDGAIEYDGTSLYYTDSTNTRRTLASNSGSQTNSSNNTFTGTNTFTGATYVSNNTASTNSTTGALVVSGGVGIGGAINVAGNANVSGALTVSGVIQSNTDIVAGGVVKAAAGTAALPSHTFKTDAATGLWQPASGALALSTAGSERLRVNSSGNVGIGVTNPTVALEVSGTIYSTSGLIHSYSNNPGQNPHITVNAGPLASFPVFQLNDQRSGGRSFNIENGRLASGTFAIRDNASGTERIVISPIGNIGVGIASPTARFMVRDQHQSGYYGSIQLSSMSGSSSSMGATGIVISPQEANDNFANDTFSFLTLSSRKANLSGSVHGGVGIIAVEPGSSNSTYGSGDMKFYLRNDDAPYHVPNAPAVPSIYWMTPKVVFKSNGNVGIGTASPTAVLDVSGTIRHGYAKTVTNSSGMTFTGLNGNVDGTYEITITGKLTVGGANKTIRIGPNGSFVTTGFKNFSHRFYDANGTLTSDLAIRSDGGFTGGFADWNADGDILSTIRIMAKTGRVRILNGSHTFIPNVSTNPNHIMQATHSGSWTDTTTNITSLAIDFNTGTFTGEIVIRTIQP